jgi:hypothetical protein
MKNQVEVLSKSLNEIFPDSAKKLKKGKDLNKTEYGEVMRFVQGFLYATREYTEINPYILVSFSCGRSDRLFKKPEEEA